METFSWNDKEVIKAAQMRVDTGLKTGAEHAAKIARRRVGVKTGELQSKIEVKKSQYENGGYVMGVFDSSGVDFEDSLGARAVFLEYGHAAPNQGRKSVKRKSIVKHVEERPFIRPALRSLKRIAGRLFEDKL